MRVSARWMALLVSLAAMLPAYGHGHLDESSVEMRYARLQDVEDRTAGDARERARQMTLAFDRDLAAEYSQERLASASDRQLEVLFQAASRVVFYAHEPVHAALLQRAAQPLRDAGLRRITVSMDSADPQTFRRMSGGRGELAQVEAGIAAAERAGFSSLKINCVVMRRVNDDGVMDLVARFRGTRHVLRGRVRAGTVRERADVDQHRVRAPRVQLLAEPPVVVALRVERADQDHRRHREPPSVHRRRCPAQRRRWPGGRPGQSARSGLGPRRGPS